MSSDEEDFVFYGTPIEREEDITSRKKKSVAEASGQLRSLPHWKQEVRDEEGRRRFHGAFSGGFSAGYYNTVGSKEGWAPQSFTSSRKNRAEIKQQSLFNFLDDDEKAEFEGNSLGTSMKFDTFGFTAAEVARKQVEKEQKDRPSAIPGPLLDEIVVPAADSIGFRLMLKMGWRRGHSIRDSRDGSQYTARREARKAFLALASEDSKAQLAESGHPDRDSELVADLPNDDYDQIPRSTPVYVLNPKQDMYGLGYDPFNGAPEFSEMKRFRKSGQRDTTHKRPLSVRDGLFSFKSGRVGPGFGIGALEELDAEDEDVYSTAYDFDDSYVQEIEEPSKLMIDDKKSSVKEHSGLPGFKVATKSDYQLERFNPPVIPKDFVPCHKFPAPLEVDSNLIGVPPPEVPPPLDNNLKVLIEGVATLVARCGTLFEDLSREKNQTNPLFSFLNGGNGHGYYSRKLWEVRQKRTDRAQQLLDSKMVQNSQKLTAESRGKILGEKPLDRSSTDLNSSSAATTDSVNLQYNLSDTFTTPASFAQPPEVTKPFLADPAKQDRFEQFLKEKYQGGLRSKDAGGASKLSEAARARERLEFEAAVEAIAKGKWGQEGKAPEQQSLDLSAAVGLQFTSGGLQEFKGSLHEEMIMKKLFPKREEFQWRPAPLLCKRFDLVDPYLGKPPPAPRVRSKMDSLIFMPDATEVTKVKEIAKETKELVLFQSDESKEVNDGDVDVKVAENIERPVDLYKAIFSDDSDDEEANSTLNQAEDPQKKIEAANTTLNRLMAGDFLESLGKELGLELPPERCDSGSLTRAPPAQKEPLAEDSSDKNLTQHQISQTITFQSSHRSSSKEAEDGFQKNHLDNDLEKLKLSREEKKGASHSNSSSEEEERRRKRSKRHRRRSFSSDSNSSDYSSDGYRHRSVRSSRKKGSSHDSSSRRKHSKHHKRRSGEESSKSSGHWIEREHREALRDKKRRL